jgi:filamentous hemagglutinin family protein
MLTKKIYRAVSILTIISFVLCPRYGFALPTGEQVIAGQADFQRDGNTMNINVSTDKMIANYNSFSIAGNEAVHFNQLSASSVALNRVIGADPSSIFGTLTANGRVFLINPNGILFAPGSQVNAAGLLASTLNISDADFLAGRYTFYGTGGSVVNQGYINTPGGYTALLGSHVGNSGVIEANLGSVALASGERITLNLDPKGIISVVIDEATSENLQNKEDAVNNSGRITADGGKVILTAKTLEGVFKRAINTSGVIEANILNDFSGEVILAASGADISSTGYISAKGGRIKLDTDDTLSLGGTYIANEINFDPEWITQTAPLYLTGDTFFWATGDINVLYDINNYDGFIKFYADAIDDNNTRHNGVGDFIQKIGTTIAAMGDIVISGANASFYNLISGKDVSISADNFINQQSNSFIAAVNNIGMQGARLSLGNIFFGGSNFSATATSGNIDVGGMIKSASVSLTTGKTTVKTIQDLKINLAPSDDSEVNQADPDKNYGDKQNLFVSGGCEDEWVWFKFDLSFIPDSATINSAILNVHATPENSSGLTIGAFHGQDTLSKSPYSQWTEETINWRNKPVSDALPTDTKNVPGATGGDWLDFDVTSGAQSDLVDNYSSWVLKYYGNDVNKKTKINSKETPDNQGRDPYLSLDYRITTLKDIDIITGYNIGVSKAGTINLNAKDNVNFGDNGSVYTNGRVNITAQNGSIAQSGTAITVIANSLVASAANGIGSANALLTEVSNLQAKNTSSGNIKVSNEGDINLTDLSGWGFAILNSGSGNVDIEAHSSINVMNPIETNGGNVSLTASDNITHFVNGDVMTEGGDFIGNAGLNYTLKDGANIITKGGLIDIFAGNNVILGDNSLDLHINAYAYHLSGGPGYTVEWGRSDLLDCYYVIVHGGGVTETYYSNPIYNSDLKEHVTVENGPPGQLIFTWKDLLGGGYNDFKFYIDPLHDSPQIYLGANLYSTSNVWITANNGSITQQSGKIYADKLMLAANSGITGVDAGDAVDTKINSLSARNNAGDIRILNDIDLAIDDLSALVGPNGVSGTNGITNGSGTVDIKVITDPNITVNAPINTNGGNVFLTADGSITHNVDGDVTTKGGKFTGNADSDGVDSDGDGLLEGYTINAGAIIDTRQPGDINPGWARRQRMGGNITIIAGKLDGSGLFGGGDIQIIGNPVIDDFDPVTVLHAGEGNAYVLTGEGDILGNALYTDTVNVYGRNVLLYAPNGDIGIVDSPLNLRATALAAEAGGLINLYEHTALEVKGFALDAIDVKGIQAGGNIDLLVGDARLFTGGTLDEAYDSPFNLDIYDTYKGIIGLGDYVNIDVPEGGIYSRNGVSLDVTAYNLDMLALDAIGASSSRIDTKVDNLWAKTLNGDVYINELDSVYLKDIQALGSTVDIITGGDTLVDNILAIGNSADPLDAAEVFLQVNGGSLTLSPSGSIIANKGGNGSATIGIKADNDILLQTGSQIKSLVENTGDALIGIAAGGAFTMIGANIEAQAQDGLAAVGILAEGDINQDAASQVKASGSDAVVGMLSGGNIDASGAIRALASDGIAGIGLFAYNNIFAHDLLAQGDLSLIGLGSLNGDITLGDLTADIVLAGALGLDGSGSIYDVGDVTAQYLGLLARNDIGTAIAPINTNVDIVSAYSWDAGDIYINQVNPGRLIQLGLYQPISGYGTLGASVAANNGIVYITSTGDMLVNSIVSPRGGVFLETSEGSIFAGNGWCPAVSRLEVEDFSLGVSGFIQSNFGYDIDPGDIADFTGEALMGLSGTPWNTIGGIDYFSPVMFSPKDLKIGPNVIAGGYSYFSAPKGTIGVGILGGLLDDPLSNPLRVCIQVVDGYTNSALPGSYLLPASYAGVVPGLILNIGGVAYPDFSGGANGAIGLSGAIHGIVRPGGTAVTGVNPSPGIDITNGGPPGYVFYDDSDLLCCPPLFGPGAVNLGPLQIWPELPPGITNVNDLLSIDLQKYLRAYYELLKNRRVVYAMPIDPTTFYFYHPLTPMDYSAFDNIKLDINAYDFIDGNLNFKDPGNLSNYYGSIGPKGGL